MPAQPQPVLEVLDDFTSKELFEEAAKLPTARGWYFGHGSQTTGEAPFWKMDLNGIAVFDAIWNAARARCEQIAGVPLQVVRQYANGHTFGLGGKPHLDDDRPGSYTLLYYPMTEWNDAWEGETVFYGEDGEIALAIRPRPNRAIFFDSRIPHAGRAPSRSCPALRVSVAFKLIAATSEPSPSQVPEQPATGLLRTYTAAFSHEEIRKLLNERLSKLAETVKLPGFRPGKIPPAVLEERYGAATRAQVLKQLGSEAAVAKPVPGSIVLNIEVVEQESDTEFRIHTLFPPDLPDPDLSSLELVRLTATPDELAQHGLTSADLDEHCNQQLLDHLDSAYDFPVPIPLVDREFDLIWKAAQAGGVSGPEEASSIRSLAQRRVRLGILAAELARRYQITESPVETQVLHRLLSQARMQTRPATQSELTELA